jgi:selT/selW/selH-like putative selenoprotein
VPRLEKGSGGTFEVRLDGELLFSKHDVHRFPAPGEVEDEIARRLAG